MTRFRGFRWLARSSAVPLVVLRVFVSLPWYLFLWRAAFGL